MDEEAAMQTYIALLRGINVGGKNQIAMPALKAALEQQGFFGVRTYINSGNVIFRSGSADRFVLQTRCEDCIQAGFALKIPVCVISAAELHEALQAAPDWWGGPDEARHNALFVIAPTTTQEICAVLGELNPAYEQIACSGQVIFWSAPIATFSRTRLTKIVQHKTLYNSVTIRNANTTRKLALLAAEED